MSQCPESRSITIVTHCYSETLPQYADHLKFQLRSVCVWEPETPIHFVICTTPTDEKTIGVVDWYTKPGIFPSNISCQLMKLDKADLFRRAIGRNAASLITRSDVVWYTDVDYFFGDGCLDDVAKQTFRDSGLTAPNAVMINTDHAAGDRMTAAASNCMFPVFDLTHFKQRKQKPVIGGVQIIGGDAARVYGYLSGTKWVNPVNEEIGFRTCRGDVKYRRWISKKTGQSSSRRIDVKNLYRIRHTENGRDYDGAGTNKGRDTW